jgi:hypothetical protein
MEGDQRIRVVGLYGPDNGCSETSDVDDFSDCRRLK